MESLLNIEEVAGIIRVSVQTVRRYVLQREIPFHKIKRAVRFLPSEIEVWIVNEGRMEGAAVEEAAAKDGELFDFPKDRSGEAPV